MSTLFLKELSPASVDAGQFRHVPGRVVMFQSQIGEELKARVQVFGHEALDWVFGTFDFGHLLGNPGIVFIKLKSHHNIADSNCLAGVGEGRRLGLLPGHDHKLGVSLDILQCCELEAVFGKESLAVGNLVVELNLVHKRDQAIAIFTLKAATVNHTEQVQKCPKLKLTHLGNLLSEQFEVLLETISHGEDSSMQRTALDPGELVIGEGNWEPAGTQVGEKGSECGLRVRAFGE